MQTAGAPVRGVGSLVTSLMVHLMVMGMSATRRYSVRHDTDNFLGTGMMVKGQIGPSCSHGNFIT